MASWASILLSRPNSYGLPTKAWPGVSRNPVLVPVPTVGLGVTLGQPFLSGFR